MDEERKEEPPILSVVATTDPAPAPAPVPVPVPAEPQPWSETSSSVPQYSTGICERSPKIIESVDYTRNRWQADKTGKTCLPQLANLIKSILNFLEKAIQGRALSESMRTVMDNALYSFCANSLLHSMGAILTDSL